MKIRPKRFLIFSTIIIFILIGIITLSDNDPELQFRLQTAGQGTVLDDIDCFIKHNGNVISADGSKVLLSDQSSASQGNPFLKVVTGTGDDAGTIKLFALGRCGVTVGANTPLVVTQTDLTFQVFSKDQSNNRILTQEKKFISTTPITLKNNEEKLFGTVVIFLDEVEKKLQAGTYDSLQEVQMFGTIKFAYQGFTDVQFTYVIEKGSVISYYPLKITATGNSNNPQVPQPQPVAKDQNQNVEEITEQNMLKDFNSCLQSGDLSCLDNVVFAPIYIIIVVFLVGGFVVSQKAARPVQAVTGVGFE